VEERERGNEGRTIDALGVVVSMVFGIRLRMEAQGRLPGMGRREGGKEGRRRRERRLDWSEVRKGGSKSRSFRWAVE